ncbi:Protein maternal effect lethal 26 [Halotydeus destructor]|nr:Protein maternal effect lethal 26 [Halotydeus destructor]
MRIETEIIASNYLEQEYEVHCECAISNGNLRNDVTYKSQSLSPPFCKHKVRLIVHQVDETLSTRVLNLTSSTLIRVKFRSFVVKCDGSKIEATKTHLHIPEEVAGEYLHDGKKIVLRYRIFIYGEHSQQHECLLKLFRSIDGPFSDFKIQADDGAVKVIKNVLALKWNYFAVVMESDEDAENIWVVNDVSAETIKDIVGYVYCDAITIKDEYYAVELVEAGHRFLLDGLLDACSKYLVAEVRPSNVLSLLVLSDSYGLTKLKEKCLAVIPRLLSGMKMKDLNGYYEYSKSVNHAKLTEECLEQTAQRFISSKKPRIN